MICWYCHWGWPPKVNAIYEKYETLAGYSAMNFGPAHIVWEDENFDRESVEHCLRKCDDGNHQDSDVAYVKQSLVEMLALPDEERDPCPEDYDGENPEKFPPPWIANGAHP